MAPEDVRKRSGAVGTLAAQVCALGAHARKAIGTAIALLALLSVACSVVPLAQAEASDVAITFGGEWKTDVAAVSVADSWTTTGSSGLTLKLRGGCDPFKFYADVSAVARGVIGSGEWDAELEIERLYVKALLPMFDVSVGKQVISWGVGHAWSPVNLFSQTDPMGVGGQEGVPGVVVKVPVGPMDFWSLVAARIEDSPSGVTAMAGAGFSGDGNKGDGHWRYGVRRRGVIGGTDWAACLAVDQGGSVLGAEAKGDLGVGWHAEGAWFLPKVGDGWRLEAVIGADYSWLDGRLLWLGEFFVDSAGAPSRDEYDLQAYLLGGLRHLGRYYAFNQLSYQLDDFTSVFGSAITNLVDYSTAWSAGARTVLAGQWNLLLVGMAMTGDEGDEFSMGPDLAVMGQLSYSF